MADQDALQAVMLRNNFYRDSYRRVLAVLLIMIVVNVGLFALVYYLITTRPKPEYFATTTDGKVIRMYALSEPVVTSAELLQWATAAATTVNTYDFTNWRKALQEASDYFTPGGWREFQDALKSSNNLGTVTTKKLSVTAVATGAPTILDKGVINGVYKWKVQLPLLITYESASTNISQPVVATMLITRTSTLETPRGIAIDAFYMSEQSLERRPTANNLGASTE
jgi:intracellular multiplication protein IcmL